MHTIGFRLLAGAVALTAAMMASSVYAAQGDTCVARTAGASSGIPGQLDANGKCVTKQTKAKAKSNDDLGDGLEASAQCKDLTFSYAKRREAACLKHGGVLEWLAQG